MNLFIEHLRTEDLIYFNYKIENLTRRYSEKGEEEIHTIETYLYRRGGRAAILVYRSVR